MGIKWWFLLLFYLVFMYFGAFIFIYLESEAEDESHTELQNLKDTIAELLNELQPIEAKESVSLLIGRIGESCQTDFLNKTAEKASLWTVWNSFFFTFNLVSTIGYGHMYPRTPQGRLFAIAYGLIGVPFNGILFTLLADFYTRKLLRMHRRSREMAYENNLAIFADFTAYVFPGFFVFIVLPACLFVFTEGWTFEQGLYYSFISLTTIGFGDLVAGNPKDTGSLWWLYRVLIFLWIIFGLGYVLMIIGFMQKAFQSKRIKEKLRRVIYSNSQRLSRELKQLKHILSIIENVRPNKSSRFILSGASAVDSEFIKNPATEMEKERNPEKLDMEKIEERVPLDVADRMEIFFEIAEDILEKQQLRSSQACSRRTSIGSEFFKDGDLESDFITDAHHDNDKLNPLPFLRKLQRISFRSAIVSPMEKVSVHISRSHPHVNSLGRTTNEENIGTLGELLDAVESRLAESDEELFQLDEAHDSYFGHDIPTDKEKGEMRWTTNGADPFEQALSSDQPSPSCSS